MARLAPTLVSLQQRVSEACASEPVFPPAEQLYRAFELTSPDAVRCIIIGQDPYHGSGQAMGLSFSVPRGIPIPPSLRNLLSELATDLGFAPHGGGDLTSWAGEGVLLLNRVLTVTKGQAGSHRGWGWEILTRDIIAMLSASIPHAVFVLWGREAHALHSLIAARHTCLASAHPSPLSAHRGFFGSRPFSRVNAALAAHGQLPISWALPGDDGENREGHTPQLW